MLQIGQYEPFFYKKTFPQYFKFSIILFITQSAKKSRNDLFVAFKTVNEMQILILSKLFIAYKILNFMQKWRLSQFVVNKQHQINKILALLF